MLTHLDRTLLREYEKPDLFVIKPYKYCELFIWRALDEYLKNPNNYCVEHFKNSFYQLYDRSDEMNYSTHRRVCNDYQFLCEHGKLIHVENISYMSMFKNQIQIFEFDNEYYIDVTCKTSNSDIEAYVISSYFGIFNLIESSQEEFISKMLNIELKNVQHEDMRNVVKYE